MRVLSKVTAWDRETSSGRGHAPRIQDLIAWQGPQETVLTNVRVALGSLEKQGFSLSGLEMPQLLWQMLKEEYPRLREPDVLEWIYVVEPGNAPAI